MTEDGYRLYSELADWWPLISPPAEYAAEAAYLAAVLGCAAPGPDQPEVLDLGSGGGHVARHLRDRMRLTLVDASAQMLAVSARLNPGCEHVQGDMRSVRLGHAFDAVLVHDAVDYITTEPDLRAVLDTAYAHCRTGGLGLFVPDYLADTFAAADGGGGGSDESGRRASFREWTWDPDPADCWVQSEYEFRLQDADGSSRVVRETHRLGSFGRASWQRLLRAAGFEPAAGTGFAGPPAASGQRRPPHVFAARRPAS